MSSFLAYMCADAEAKAARQEWEAASARMTVADIRKRLAEIKSQNLSLASLCQAKIGSPEYEAERERLYAAAFYVVVGRLP
jgi:hypothetical protein